MSNDNLETIQTNFVEPLESSDGITTKENITHYINSANYKTHKKTKEEILGFYIPCLLFTQPHKPSTKLNVLSAET